MEKRQLTTEELKEKEIEILNFFHKYCEENELYYCLAAGSLIGAIRHNGFIPWDDDIDVYMFREDYMKLINIFPKDGVNGLKLLTPFTDDKCPITFCKLYDISSLKYDNEVEKKYQLYGIDIDIFPLDYVSSDVNERNKFYKHQYWRFKIFLGIVGKLRKERNIFITFVRNLYMIVCKGLAKLNIINANRIAIKINRSAMANEKSDYVISSMLPLGRVARPYAKTISFKERYLHDFENKKFYIPAGYDEYLTNTYGEYMKLPKLELQVTHHLSSTYVIEE